MVYLDQGPHYSSSKNKDLTMEGDQVSMKALPSLSFIIVVLVVMRLCWLVEMSVFELNVSSNTMNTLFRYGLRANAETLDIFFYDNLVFKIIKSII